MKRLFLTSVLTLGALSAGASVARADVITLTASLTGAEENPAINTGAFGSATITVDTGARTVTYRVEVFNLPSGVTASHIHVGAVGTNGPIIVNFAPPVNASNDFGYAGTVPESQWLLRPDQGIRSGDDIIQAILGNNTYVNVHSTVNGGGEIRGKLIRQQ
jgi:hypothetical protein